MNTILRTTFTLLAFNFCISHVYGQFEIALLKDINPATNFGFPYSFFDAGELLYFSTSDGTNGDELWATDGTTEGTFIVKDIKPDVVGSFPFWLTQLNEKVYFAAEDKNWNMELWVTDGTEAGTQLLKDMNPSGGSEPEWLTKFDNRIFFSADETSSNRELWVTDGTTAGTVLFKDLNPTGSSNPKYLFPYDGKLYFTVNDEELWISDGTAANTTMIKMIDFSEGFTPFPFEGKIYFSADNGTDGLELWVTDGTSAGTFMVKDINAAPNAGSQPRFFQEYQGKLFFTAWDDVSGIQMWVTDGTNAGTSPFKSFTTSLNTSSPKFYTEHKGLLYFQNGVGFYGFELWVSDGTAVGTRMLKDLNPFDDSYPHSFTLFQDHLIFIAENEPDKGQVFALLDSSNIISLSPEDADEESPGAFFGFVTFKNDLYFVANYNESGNELWKLSASNVAIDERSVAEDMLTFYPNPAKNQVNLILPGQHTTNHGKVRISNSSGKLIREYEGDLTNPLDMAQLPKGIYYFQVFHEATTYFNKIVLE